MTSMQNGFPGQGGRLASMPTFLRAARAAAVVAAALALMVAYPSTGRAQSCPSLAGSEDFGLGNQGVAGVAIAGHYAFTADTYGLSVYDLSEMASPQRVAQLLLPGRGTDVALSTGEAFVAVSDGTLRMVDVSNPLAPTLVGSVELPGSPDRVVLGDGFVYVSYRDPQYHGNPLDPGLVAEGLQIVEVSDPTDPVLRGRLDAPDTLLFLSKLVPGPPGVVYAGDWLSGLRTIDVSDPDHPVLAGSKKIGATALARVGEVLYVTDGSRLSVVDISDPLGPELVRTVDARGIYDGVVQGSVLLTAGASFQVFDLTDPTNPVPISSLGSLGGERIAASYDVAVVADSELSLHLVDTAHPDQPTEKAFLSLSGSARQVEGSGRWVYVANGKSLRILDVNDPEHPVRRGRWDTSERIDALHVLGDLVYVQQLQHGLTILDVSDPDQPVLVGAYNPNGFLLASAVAGDTAYLGLDKGNLEVVDVSDPAHPVLEASVDNRAAALWCFGSTLYVRSPFDAMLSALDVTYPANPVVLAWSDLLEDDVDDLTPAGPYVVAATGGAGVQVLDARDLHRIGSIQTTCRAVSVEVHGSVAVVGCEAGGVEFVDIGDPGHPTLVASARTRRPVRDATVAGVSSTVWTAGDAIVEGVRADCVPCPGITVSVSDDTIPAGGGTAMVTATMTDLAGLPASGQSVIGWASGGHLGSFSDKHDGTYTAVFSPGPEPGTAQLGVGVNGGGCWQRATINVEGAASRGSRPVRRARRQARPTAFR